MGWRAGPPDELVDPAIPLDPLDGTVKPNGHDRQANGYDPDRPLNAEGQRVEAELQAKEAGVEALPDGPNKEWLRADAAIHRQHFENLRREGRGRYYDKLGDTPLPGGGGGGILPPSGEGNGADPAPGPADPNSAIPEPEAFADLDELIAYLNSRFAVVNEAGKAIIYESVMDPILHRRVLLRITFEDFKKLYLNRMHTAIGFKIVDGERVECEITKTWANWWLPHHKRRQYLGGVVFDPTNKAPANCWNLWTGFKVEPKEGDWHLMREHVERVICAGDRESSAYLFDTCARMFQFPDRPGEVATALCGLKGSGKGIFLNYLCDAWGAHGIHISNPAHLVGHFNDHLRDCVMLFADEAFFAGDRQHEGVLKALITEPTLPIEGKYKAVVSVPNLLHVYMASNNDWMVPASLVERRWFLLNVAANRCGDLPYFKAIANEMANGGLAAMIWDFLHRDITDFEPRAVPQTEGLRDQKLHSLDSLQRWWLAVLERGFVYRSRFGAPWFAAWQPFYTTELLWRSYLQWCSETRPYDRKSQVQLGIMMTALYPTSRPRTAEPVYEVESVSPPPQGMARQAWLDQEAIVRKQHAYGYKLQGLADARARFLEIVDVDATWRQFVADEGGSDE